jgi:hypothetical protein
MDRFELAEIEVRKVLLDEGFGLLIGAEFRDLSAHSGRFPCHASTAR